LEAGSVPPSLNFPQLNFVKPSSGFHPVTWERVKMVFDLIFKGLMLFGYEPICFDFHIGISNGNNKKNDQLVLLVGVHLFQLDVC
jgi:hypothetical protein